MSKRKQRQQQPQPQLQPRLSMGEVCTLLDDLVKLAKQVTRADRRGVDLPAGVRATARKAIKQIEALE